MAGIIFNFVSIQIYIIHLHFFECLLAVLHSIRVEEGTKIYQSDICWVFSLIFFFTTMV